MPPDFGSKKQTEKGRCKGKDQAKFDSISFEGQTRHLNANMDMPPAEGNFCDDNHHPVKPHIVARYNRHMDYVNSDRMANSYSMSRRNFKCTMKLFFHLLDVTVLNSWILLSLCGAKYTHRDFRLLQVKNLIEKAGRSQDHPTPNLVGRPSAAATNVMRLDGDLTAANTGQQNPTHSTAVFV